MEETVILNGKQLSLNDVYNIAYHNYQVAIDEDAYELVHRGRQLVFELVDENVPVYGFNTGVGWNKDKTVFSEFFEKYNTNLILSHSLGAGEILSNEEVRAIMCLRLNSILVGCSGIDPKIIYQYVAFINKGIHPHMPRRGSVGVGDITSLSHIGLAFIGQGKVNYKNEVWDAIAAIEDAGLEKSILGPKDGLAIVSSNAFSAGIASLVVEDAKRLFNVANLVYSLSLEAFDGNVTPLDLKTTEYRPYKGNVTVAKDVNRYLKNSSIYEPNWKKPVQDPLSFRDIVPHHGALKHALDYVEDLLLTQLNSSDDNPCMILDERRMISCSNYVGSVWVLGMELLGQSLSHVSKMACHRMIKLGNPDFTNLPRFLSPNDDVLGFATLQKVYCSMDAEIRHLSNPANNDFFSLAGDIEDDGTNAPYVALKTKEIVDLLYRILGVELMHAAQAIDLRKDHKLGEITQKTYDLVREALSFYQVDRNLSIDIEKSYQIARSEKLYNLTK